MKDLNKHMISHFQVVHIRTNFHNQSTKFMAESAAHPRVGNKAVVQMKI